MLERLVFLLAPLRDVNIHPNPPLIAPLIAPQCNINQSIKDGIFVIITQTILLLRITHINTNTIITGLTVVCISDTTTHSRMRVVWIGETQNHVLHKIIMLYRCGDRFFTLLSVALLYITLTTTALHYITQRKLQFLKLPSLVQPLSEYSQVVKLVTTLNPSILKKHNGEKSQKCNRCEYMHTT